MAAPSSFGSTTAGLLKPNGVIDLSYAAALKLDMVREGTTLVEIQAEDPDGAVAGDRTRQQRSALRPGRSLWRCRTTARRLRDRLGGCRIGPSNLRSDMRSAAPMSGIRIGPRSSPLKRYDALVERLHGLGVGKVVLRSKLIRGLRNDGLSPIDRGHSRFMMKPTVLPLVLAASLALSQFADRRNARASATVSACQGSRGGRCVQWTHRGRPERHRTT
jgi:hypothetical protein